MGLTRAGAFPRPWAIRARVAVSPLVSAARPAAARAADVTLSLKTYPSHPNNATAKAVRMVCHVTHSRFGQEPVCHNCH